MLKLKKSKGKKRQTSDRKINLSGMETRIFMYILAVFAIALVAVCVKYALTNDTTAEEEIPETYYKFSHKYDSEVADFSDPLAEPETEPQEGSVSDTVSSVKSAELLTPISCWGDSFTVPYSETSISYAGVIANFSDRTVYNIGAPADSLKAIAGRQGGIPFLTTPFIIPQDKTPVEISIDSSIGGRLDLDFSKNAGLNPCVIKGVEGMISKINGKLYFTRSASGSQVMVYEPETVETRAMTQRRDDICIFFVGSDSSLDTPEQMIQAYKSMAEYLGTAGKYLVLSPIVGDRAKIEQAEQMLAAEFGDRFLNTREALCAAALEQHDDYKVSEEELALAKTGEIPSSYFKDANYFSEAGAVAAGSAAYKKLEDLGYFDDELPAAEDADK